MTTNDQASFLNEEDRIRIWRAFGTMPYSGGLFDGLASGPKDLTVGVIVQSLEGLNARLLANVNLTRTREAKLNEYNDVFSALGALANLIGNAQKEAWKR